MGILTLSACIWLLAGTAAADDDNLTDPVPLVRAYVDAATEDERLEALAALQGLPPEAVLEAARTPLDFEALPAGRTTHQITVAATGEEASYMLVIPEGYDPAQSYPLWLALHGTGGQGRDCASFLQKEVNRKRFIVACPDAHPTRKGKGWGFTREERELSVAVLHDVKRHVNIDTNRVVIGGWSRGGHGTYDVAGHHPAHFAAANPIIGAPRAPYVGMLRSLYSMKVYPMNGVQDEELLVAASRSGVNFLEKKIRADVTYVEDENQGHALLLEHLPAAADVCLEAARDPLADKIMVASHPEGLAEGLWLRIDALQGGAYKVGNTITVRGLSGKTTQEARLLAFHKAVFEGTARIEAKRGRNAFTLKSKHVAGATLLIAPEAIDWKRLVRVTANGRTVFSGKLERSVETLLDGLRDRRDPNRLFFAEIPVTIEN